MTKKKHQTMVRVNKREKSYVMIDKTGLNDVRLSWKAKGLLCYLLSLPDDWQVYVNEIKNHASDGRDSTSTAIKELMNLGYCIRTVSRNELGQIKGYIYNIFEIPNDKPFKKSQNASYQPKADFPYSDNLKMDIPITDQLKTDNPKLLNNNITNETEIQNNQSIYPKFEMDEIDSSRNKSLFQKYEELDIFTDKNYNVYRTIVSENISYGFIKEKYPYESIVDDILEIMIEVVSTTKDTIRVNGEDMPKDIVKSTFLKLNDIHIEYVLDCMNENTSKAKNIKAYLITALYNAPKTINAYYFNLVQHDMANNNSQKER